MYTVVFFFKLLDFYKIRVGFYKTEIFNEEN